MPYKERERIIVTIALSSIVVLAVTFSIGSVYAFVATLSASTISRGTPSIRVSATGFAGEGFVRVDGTAYNALYTNSLYACVDPLFYSNVSFVSANGTFSMAIPTATLPTGDYGVYVNSIGPAGSACLHFTVTS
ncbi:MAG TPA: hypothetical protein VJZ03_08630 [Candidatus Bathyarchaeia archaeon]|nr:hypothetical protein [Candidatus Bathyarchaeia archaeon]